MSSTPPPPPKRTRLHDQLQALPTPTRVATLEKLSVIAEAVTKGDLGPALGVVPGTQVEVLWAVGEEDDDDDEQDVWWPAVVLGKTAKTHALNVDPEDEEQGEEEQLMAMSSSSDATKSASPDVMHVPVYEIRYDARPPDFPNPARSCVCITDEHEFLDVDTDSMLPWRFVGSTWTPPPEHYGLTEETSQITGSSDIALERHPILQAVEAYFEEMVLSPLTPAAAAAAAADLLEEDEDEGATITPLSKEEADRNASMVVEKVLEHLATEFQSKLQSLPASAQHVVVDQLSKFRKEMQNTLSQLWQTKGRVTVQDAKRVVDAIQNARER